MSAEPGSAGSGTVTTAPAKDSAKDSEKAPVQDSGKDAASPAPAAAGEPAARKRANDFSTQTRVEYVFRCIGEHRDRPFTEMQYKCICGVDTIAGQVSQERWIELDTTYRARTISGERGGEFRDRKEVPGLVKEYRRLEALAADSCFIPEKTN